MNEASSAGIINNNIVEETEQEPPVVYVIPLNPTKEESRLTVPVIESRIKYGLVVEKTPPDAPVIMGIGSAEFLQKADCV